MSWPLASFAVLAVALAGGFAWYERSHPSSKVLALVAALAALAVAGEHADVYMTWGEPLASVREQIARVRAAAAPFGRAPRISVSFRPIVADTEAAAWEKAEAIRRQRKLARKKLQREGLL